MKTVLVTPEEEKALASLVRFADDELGRSHEGYYHSTQGWVGVQVSTLLAKIQAAPLPVPVATCARCGEPLIDGKSCGGCCGDPDCETCS